jgi:hypothetical protein
MKSKTLLLAGALRAFVALSVCGGAVVPAAAIAAPTAPPSAADLAKAIAAAIDMVFRTNPGAKTADFVAAINQVILDSGVTPAVATDALVQTRPIVIANKEMSKPVDEALTRSTQLAQTPVNTLTPGTGGNGGQFGPGPASNQGGGGGNATYLPNRG